MRLESWMSAVVAAAAMALSAGCIFAPSTCGGKGVAVQGSEQFDNYLARCSGRYALLADCCSKWGTPAAVQIGSSGGYFVWAGRDEWVKVGSFSASVVSGRHPKRLRQYVGGKVAEAARRRPGRSAGLDGYVVERFERTSDDGFAYAFRIRLKEGAQQGLSAMAVAKDELRRAVAADYAAAYGGGDIRVDFPEFSMKGAVVEGRAEVMRISVKSLTYDAVLHKGVISVRIGANRFEDARKWVRKNIETLAADKNVALTTGQIPPDARFFLGAERILDGGVLEIEFETE